MERSLKALDSIETASNEILASRAQAGSLPCFEELARRLQGPLLQFMASRTGDATLAEDLVQETFLKAYANLRTYQPSSAFRGWIFTIAYNQMIQTHRGESARRRTLKNYAPQAIAKASEAAEDTRGEELSGLWAAARAELNKEQFTVLWLFYAEDLPLNEIARVVDRNAISVRVQLFRARRKLQKVLAQTPGSLAVRGKAAGAPSIVEGCL
jgi:RNA polymerase sigma-70 factor (ECF subfamily)